MTKTLTEQWKRKKLKRGAYYIKLKDDSIWMAQYDDICKEFVTEIFRYSTGWRIKEVLEEVPSYDEYQTLIADQLSNNEGVEINAELEAENKRLKEQLKEAQNLIIYTANGHDHLFATIQCEDYMHKHHLPKWGVK